jgi:hypothetical protein
VWRRSLTAFDYADLTQAIPELGALRQVIEHGDWHTNDVLQQSLDLFKWVKQLPGSLPAEIKTPETVVQGLLASVLDPQQGHHYTKHELLAFAALIHDVGKAPTYQLLPDGATRCPEHEEEGARMAPGICARFDFTPAEARFITALVGAHGEPYALFKEIATLPADQQLQRMRDLQAKHKDHLQPLLLLAYGDLVTSQLQATQSQKYATLIDFYQRWMRSELGEEEETNAP